MELKRDRTSRQFFVLGIIITVISAVFLGGYLAASSGYEKAEGACITAQRGHRHNYNIYEFTVNGTAYTCLDYCSSSDKTKPGDTVTVRYDPNDPSKTFSSDTAALAAIALAIGLLFIGSGITKTDKDQPMWAEDDPANKYLEEKRK